MPLPIGLKLIVDGVEITNHHDYALALYSSPEGSRPTLYYKGKRVTKEWSLYLLHSQPEDKGGCSA